MITEKKENYMSHLSQMIRDARENSGVTQMELADELSISLRTYQRIEKGETEPTLSQIYAISKTLRVPLDFFLYSTPTLTNFGIGCWEYFEKPKLLHACGATFDIYEFNSNEKITERMLIDKIHPEDLEHFKNHFLINENAKSVYEIQYRIRTDNGIKWLVQKCMNIFDANGTKIKRTGFVFDISKLKKNPG